jgi:hypothetical protein
MGNNDKAEEFYVKALGSDKNSLVAKMNIGRIKYDNKKYSEALEDFGLVFANAKNNLLKAEAAYMTGQIYMLGEYKDLGKAEQYMEQASVIDSSYPLAWVGVGQAAFIKGIEDESANFTFQMERAVSSFDKAIKLNSNQTMAYLFKARLYVFTGNENIAGVEYNNALSAVDKDIVLMSDDKERTKTDILAEMKMYNFSTKKVSFINTIVKKLPFKIPTVHALEFYYGTEAEARIAIAKHNSNTSPGHGHWIYSNGVCENGITVTWGRPSPPPCVPHAPGACSTTCGPGTASNGCSNVACDNGACPSCGVPPHKESYERTSEVEADGSRCSSGSMSHWFDGSELASVGGKAWVWKCSRTNVTVDCLSYKLGECEDDPTDPPYSTRADACRFGVFNSVRLVEDFVTDGVARDTLFWQCGTGEAPKRLGSFSEDLKVSGDDIDVDYYGPKNGGVKCKCIPDYEYTCVGTKVFNRSCDDNCGGEIIEAYKAYKKDTTCFENEPRIEIDKAEYLAGSGEHCINESVQCASCGTQNSEGGIHHETN